MFDPITTAMLSAVTTMVGALRAHGGTVHVELRDEQGNVTGSDTIAVDELATTLDNVLSLTGTSTTPPPQGDGDQ